MTTEIDLTVSRWLEGLPDRDPPAHLWHRILESQLHHQRRLTRRNGWLAAGGIAAALVMALSMGLILGRQGPTPAQLTPIASSQMGNQLTALMQRTEQLERSLREQRSEFARLASTQQQLVRAQQAQIIALDQSLALAYQRDEPPENLARLWQRRVDLMADLVSIYDTAPGAGSV